MADLRDLYQEVILEHSKRRAIFANCRMRITGRRDTTRFAAITSPCISNWTAIRFATSVSRDRDARSRKPQLR